MTKKKAGGKRKTKGEILSPPTQLPVDLGKTVPVTVKKASAEDLSFTLSDGTVLKMRPIIMGIERSLGKFNPTGEPIYQVSAGYVLQTIVPKRLKRKVRE